MKAITALDKKTAVVLFVLSIFISIVFLRDLMHPKEYQDSGSYFLLNDSTRGLYMDTSVRQPLYPLFTYVLATLMSLGTTGIALAQTLLGAGSVVIGYILLRKLGVKPPWIFIGSGLMLFNVGVLSFQAVILSETLALFMLMVFLLAAMNYVERYNTVAWFWVIASGLLLIFTRSVFLYLPIATLSFFLFREVFWIQKAKERSFGGKYFQISLLVLGLVSTLTTTKLYEYYNYVNFGFPGFSRIGQVNLLGKLIQYGYLEKEETPEKNLITVTYWKNTFRYKDPWELLSAAVGSQEPYALESIAHSNDFIATVLKRNLGNYMVQSLFLMPRVIADSPSLFYSDLRFGIVPSSGLVQVTFLVYGIVRILALLVLAVNALFLLFKTDSDFSGKSHREKVLVLLMFIGYTTVVAAFLAYSEYPRMRMPMELLLDITVVLVLNLVFRRKLPTVGTG